MTRAMARPAKKKAKPSAKSGQTLASAIADAPRLTDRKATHDRIVEWLSGIGRSKAGKVLKKLLVDAPKVDSLLAVLADGSPYLWELASGDADRLLSLLCSDPDKHFADLLAST